VNVVDYSTDGCTGTSTTELIESTMCITTSTDDAMDDTYYAPGSGADTFSMVCGGSSPGGGSSNSNALSAGAIAGIVIGGVAFLAICVGAAVFLLGAGFGGKAAMASQAQSAAADNSNL
jgi:hypothetical protein